MGATLSQPVVDKKSESGEDNRLAYGISSMQGWRVTMEDSHAAVLDLPVLDDPTKASSEGRISFFGVYDGHCGDMVAMFSGENVHKILAKQPSFKDSNYEQALKDGFLAADSAISQDPKYNGDVSGCTASTALITNTKIHVANAGDSRAVLSVKGRAKPLSFDHKPQNEGERARICAAGGFVNSGRVNGNLALSRAIGDFKYKRRADLPPEQQMVTAFPDVVVHEVSDDDEFLVIACDGIWECLSSQAVIEFVRRGIAAKQELHTICESVMDHCLDSRNDVGGVGRDNMTMIVVALLKNKMTKEEWYDLIAKRVVDGGGPCTPPKYAEFRGHRINSVLNRAERPIGPGRTIVPGVPGRVSQYVRAKYPNFIKTAVLGVEGRVMQVSVRWILPAVTCMALQGPAAIYSCLRARNGHRIWNSLRRSSYGKGLMMLSKGVNT